MKAKEIQDLIEFIAQTGLDEVNIETEQVKISVKRHPSHPTAAASLPTVVTPQPLPALSTPPLPTATPSVPTIVSPAKETSYVTIKSPMIGTFYRSANPDAPLFVSVGDTVKKGQTVCIIEAMKLFNEIESEVSGTVVKVLAENASPVEYDQPLFLIDPA